MAVPKAKRKRVAPRKPAPKPTVILEKILHRLRSIGALSQSLPRVPLLHVDLEFVDSKRMRELNAYYRGKNEATDVLSFAGPEPFFSLGHLGEIVICRSVMEKQARAHGLKASEEMTLLLVHGVLHLLGFDHEASKPEAIQMASLEGEILEKIWPAKTRARVIPGLIARFL